MISMGGHVQMPNPAAPGTRVLLKPCWQKMCDELLARPFRAAMAGDVTTPSFRCYRNTVLTRHFSTFSPRLIDDKEVAKEIWRRQ